MSHWGEHFTGFRLESNSTRCEGMSGRDIKNWMAIAQKAAVNRAVAQGGAKFYKLTVADMLATASGVRVRGTLKTPPAYALARITP